MTGKDLKYLQELTKDKDIFKALTDLERIDEIMGRVIQLKEKKVGEYFEKPAVAFTSQFNFHKMFEWLSSTVVLYFVCALTAALLIYFKWVNFTSGFMFFIISLSLVEAYKKFLRSIKVSFLNYD